MTDGEGAGAAAARAASPRRLHLQVLVGPDAVEVDPADGWRVTWVDRAGGIARLTDGHRSVDVVVEGGGADWVVTLRGRRMPVTVRTWREQVLAEASAVGAAAHRGPLEIRASLPGLVVAVLATPAAEVAEGEALVRIEAMKMQNEVRAPRSGRVAAILVEPGRTVGTGDVLLRLE